MYAERKQIPLKDIRIKLSHHRKKPAQDLAAGTAHDPFDTIEGHIELEGDLDAGQRRRMLEIARRCWMYRTLSAGLAIRFHPQEA